MNNYERRKLCRSRGKIYNTKLKRCVDKPNNNTSTDDDEKEAALLSELEEDNEINGGNIMNVLTEISDKLNINYNFLLDKIPQLLQLVDVTGTRTTNSLFLLERTLKENGISLQKILNKLSGKKNDYVSLELPVYDKPAYNTQNRYPPKIDIPHQIPMSVQPPQIPTQVQPSAVPPIRRSRYQIPFSVQAPPQIVAN